MQSPKSQVVALSGGLDLESNPASKKQGSLISCRNFGVKVGGGYYRCGGYERFDGQPRPHLQEDKAAARALIQPVPGEGDVLGVWLFNGVVYAFRNNVGSTEAKMYKSTGSGWSEVATGVTLNPGGSFEFVNYNFYGSTTLARMYGVDGANLPFMFDGTTFTQITVTGATGYPRHIAAHSNHLFLSYDDGQWVHSGIGEPTQWDAATQGAGAGGVGDDIVAIKPTVGGALAFFSRNRINILYGSSQADWQANDIRKQDDQSGAIAGTIQDVGGDIVYLDDKGFASLTQTQNFGNFQSATLDRNVKSYALEKRNKVVSSFVSRSRSEYRLLWSNASGTGVTTITFDNGRVEGFGELFYPFHASCVCSLEDTSGSERLFAGASNGYVYELDVGGSFDGADIESYFTLSYMHMGMPQYKKRWRSAKLSIDAPNDVTLRIKPSFDYADPNKAGHRVVDAGLTGSGAIWGTENWGSFTWGNQLYSESDIDITNTARNMALQIYHKSADSLSFDIYDITINYSMRGFVR